MKSVKTTYRDLFDQKVKKNWYKVAASILSGMIRAVAMLMPTFLIRNMLNALIDRINTTYLIQTALLTLLMPTIVLILYVIDARISKYLFDIVKDIRTATFKTILSQKLRWVLSKDRSELFNKTISSTIQIAEFYYYTLSNLAWYSTTALVGSLLMIRINASIASLLLVLSVIQVMVAVFRGGATMRASHLVSEVKTVGDMEFTTVLHHNSYIKVAGLKDWAQARCNNWIEDSLKAFNMQMSHFFITQSMTFVIVSLKSLLLYVLAQQLFVKGLIRPGDVVALGSYAIYLTPVFFGLQDWVSDAYKNRVNKNRVNQFLDLEEVDTTLSEVKNTDSSCISNIEVKDLGFSYRKDASFKPLIDKLSFKVDVDSHLYVIGPSGSGKSTLIDILMSLEDDYTGCVLYNGINAKVLHENYLLDNIVCVSQHSEIIQSTLWDNLLYSCVHHSDERIISLLDKLKLGYLVGEMPGGLSWDMNLHPRALSDGEKKRICIARAILSEPNVLILDEPTAGLDMLNKQFVMDTIKGEMTGKILIVVTHDALYETHDNVLNLAKKRTS
ncbi:MULTISPECIES: ABC transporter ATP-binding protein [unclassified Fusibacter]|uniref:ATP-binding cassette domain-containing protein n=1 Tax=unclassified Fusibacter TaxID=2624464 RepID=UPI0010112E4A|nr:MULTISPECIES: ABC transporter ATP-binding protein [unclassified Fusibacter]MCK8058568.1 ABC transporter ATP-binding protein/permease [Fusibacter sp. A2]NPE22662.1 ABC transporter ATP-binding protein [Fusibacter sp. A1]RXV60225.1 ABC transporter ATP-binding protein [Fusibacter sp. A1]